MNCIIIDDEETARIILQQLVGDNKNLELKGSFDSAVEAIKFLNKNSAIDLIFLDIHMPAFSGFDLIETLQNPPKIILTSSDKNFALAAFEYEMIVDYLVKPFTKERFKKALKKASNNLLSTKDISPDQSQQNSEDDEMYISVSRRLIKITISSIKLIEARGDYMLIKTTSEDYIVYSTLKKIEEKLPASSFIKIHRSFIINIKMIVDIEDNSVLIGKDVIPISRSKRAALMEVLNLL